MSETKEQGKHTPGPWSQNPTGDIGWWHIGTYETPICEVESDRAYQGGRQGKANARLIAAAPELLEALKYLRFEAAKQITHRNDSGCDALRDADAAIAKAEGRND